MSASLSLSQVNSCSPNELRIGGVVPLTTIDYPNHLACVLFCQGCAWRCRYCHNPQLIPPRADDELSWSQVLPFLKKRQGLLEAVVFSGGEPTLQKELVSCLVQVKEMGFLVGLHSAGIKPILFKQALPWVDWVGFDVKALPEDHTAVTCTKQSGEANWQSLAYLLESGVGYEVRTTVHWHLFNVEKLTRLAERLKSEGVTHFVVQCVRQQSVLDNSLSIAKQPENLQEVWDYFSNLFPFFTLRSE